MRLLIYGGIYQRRSKTTRLKDGYKVKLSFRRKKSGFIRQSPYLLLNYQ